MREAFLLTICKQQSSLVVIEDNKRAHFSQYK